MYGLSLKKYPFFNMTRTYQAKSGLDPVMTSMIT